ncbi:hypothetical protein GAYE_SCF31G4917 [Galdieria yellowstonensis]|uniref:Coproporphyrinogen oxidase n=1 Tax=Galdieria yellowstonensis TaxID=3028027 RepID=A0AAV9IIE5_9RHOD|nr:hypothetical protein GAYE_SCF31G4917 [Galdieria yellowstonensis]
MTCVVAFLCLPCQQHFLSKKPLQRLLCRKRNSLSVAPKRIPAFKCCWSRPNSGYPFSATDVFTFLALRAQESICKDTAEVDDYSSSDFQERSDGELIKDKIPSLCNWCPPSTHIWSDRKSSRMLGGRKFSRAFVDVWRASQKERHPLLGRRFYQGRRNAHVVWVQTLDMTAATPLTENLDIAGVTLFLEPRNVQVPIFRADLRYFELNHGGLWWFAGSVDLIISALSSASIFAKEAQVFCGHWKHLCKKHRSVIPFVRDPWQESIPFGDLLGDFDAVERGRSRAFAFANDVLDSFLSAYLPLTRKQGSSSKHQKRTRSSRPHLGFFQLTDPNAETNSTRRTYSLSGGTVLESSFCEEAPLAMWRFNLFPPPGTAAAKVIAELRSGKDRSHIDPLDYLWWL